MLTLPLRCLVVVLTLSLPGPLLWAGDPSPTTVTVQRIHCPNCAKRIVAKLSTVAGVASVQANVQTATVLVTPQPHLQPSPRALWEALEKTGHKPIRLEGPSGTFTEKPAS